MKEKILNLLNNYLLEIQQYIIKEKKGQELDTNRILKDIEQHGITESFIYNERLFIYKNDKIEEKSVIRYKLRKRDYGTDLPIEENGNPISNYLQGDEEAIIIVSSLIDTKPKGPHIFKKELEIYYLKSSG